MFNDPILNSFVAKSGSNENVYTKEEVYTKTEIDEKIGEIETILSSVVEV